MSNSDDPPSSDRAAAEDSPEELADKLNRETGVLPWQDLVRYFARGVMVKVDASLDLVEVAASVTNDDTARFTQWMEAGKIQRASDDDARDWNMREPEFWCVVTAPWVLVQESRGDYTLH